MVFLVVGDANADVFAALVRFPREGDDSPLEALGWGSGGSAANVATGLARLGARARLLARVGEDPAAEVALRAARAAGVDLGPVQRDRALATGLCFAAVSPGGERTFFSFRGANAALEPSGATLLDVGWLHVAGHALLEGRQRETTRGLLAAGARRGVPVSLDLCLPLLRQAPGELFDLAPPPAIVFANELELAAIAEPIDAALAALVRRGVGLAAAKLGARGSRLEGRARGEIPPFAVDARDSTGAGDGYVAGFLAAYARGAAPELAARVGNAVGALSASRAGAAAALPSLAEVCELLAARGDVRALEAIAPEGDRQR